MMIEKGLSPLHALFAIPEKLYQWNESIELEFVSDKVEDIRRLFIVRQGIFHIYPYNDQTNKWFTMKPGDIIALPPHTGLRIDSSPQKLASCLLIEYRLTGSGDSLLYASSPILLRNQPIIVETARQIAIDWSNPSAQPWSLHMAFINLLQQIDRLAPQAEQAQQEAVNWLEDSVDYIQSHYNEQLSREQLAQRAGVSPEHFSRMFHKRTGQKLTEYMTLIRIRKAQELLLSVQAATLDQVAQQTGFRDGLYLSRRFKKTIGISPNQYRHNPILPGALNINHSASLWALGIQPQWGIFTNWHKKMFGAKAVQCATILSNGSYPSLDHFQLPDVIVSYQMKHETIDLWKLAPLVQLPHRQMDWKAQFRSIAGLVHKTEQAEEILGRIEEKASTLREKLHGSYGKVRNAIVWELDKNNKVYAISGHNGRGAQLLYGELGFHIPQALINKGILEHGYMQATWEELPDYDADFIFFTGTPSTKQDALAFNAILQSNAWKQLTAVQANQVYMLNNSDLFWGYDPLSSNEQLDTLQKFLLPK